MSQRTKVVTPILWYESNKANEFFSFFREIRLHFSFLNRFSLTDKFFVIQECFLVEMRMQNKEMSVEH